VVALAAPPAGRLGRRPRDRRARRDRVPPAGTGAVALLAGQLASILPDLQFRFGRRPHEPSMDLWLGHISLHTGPSPVLVALGSLLLGGWAHIAVTVGRRRLAVPLALAGLVLVVVACVLARPLPTTLADYPADSAPVVAAR
jgi:hypothetical protein